MCLFAYGCRHNTTTHIASPKHDVQACLYYIIIVSSCLRMPLLLLFLLMFSCNFLIVLCLWMFSFRMCASVAVVGVQIKCHLWQLYIKLSHHMNTAIVAMISICKQTYTVVVHLIIGLAAPPFFAKMVANCTNNKTGGRKHSSTKHISSEL